MLFRSAAVIGFLGNEMVAVFRNRVGKEIGSAALVVDGYHVRTDGFTSLAVWRGRSACGSVFLCLTQLLVLELG